MALYRGGQGRAGQESVNRRRRGNLFGRRHRGGRERDVAEDIVVAPLANGEPGAEENRPRFEYSWVPETRTDD